VASLLGQVKNLEAVAKTFVEQIGPAVQGGWLALWKAQPESDTLLVLSTWQSPSTQAGDLEDFSLHWKPTLGEGMVGEASRTSQPQSSGNVIQDMILPRSLYAKGAGLVNGLWIPTSVGRAGFVLECLWDSKPNSGITAMVAKLAKEIAVLVERRKQ
jgi:hypothetical protein